MRKGLGIFLRKGTCTHTSVLPTFFLFLSLSPSPSLLSPSLPPSQHVDIHVHVHVPTFTECVQYMYTYIHCILDIQYHDVVVVCISGLCMHHHIISFNEMICYAQSINCLAHISILRTSRCLVSKSPGCTCYVTIRGL